MSQDKRRVVVLVTEAIFPYFRGGRDVRYREVAQRLGERADVYVCTMRWWSGPSKMRDGSFNLRAVSRLYPMYSGKRRTYRQAFLFALGCLRLLWFRFDVAEVDQFPNFHIFTLRLVTWVKRKPLTVTWHEVWGPTYWREYLGRLGSVGWFIEWLTMRVPDQLIAASPETGVRLREVLGDRASISVVPNGIDLDAVRNAHPNDAPVDIVTVGRLIQHKNVDMLLECIALLHSEGLPVTCRVIGEGPQRDTLHERARELGIESAVDFRHDVTEQKDIYAHTKSAQVAVFPTSREGFGMAVLEAIACGIPVVTTSAPDNLAQHLVARYASGVICDPSVPAIAAEVRRVIEDGNGGECRQAAVEEAWLAEHGWDAAVDQIAQVLGI